MTRTRLGKLVGRATLAANVALSGAAVCSVAHAQDSLEGPGFRAGRLEIHPSIAARAGYDTNVFRGDDEPGGQPEDGAWILAITPSVALTTLSTERETQGESRGQGAPPLLEFRLGAGATYMHFGDLQVGARESETIDNVAFDVDGLLQLLPKRPVNFDLGLVYNRSVAPFTVPAGEIQNNDFAVNRVNPSARVNFESRGGVLTSYVGFSPLLNPFEGDDFKYLSSITYGFEGGSAWRFLPTSALVHDVNVDLVDYYRLDDQGDRAVVLLSGSKRVRSRLGFSGAFTNNFSVRVLGGYAVGLFDDERFDDFGFPIGEAVLTQRFGVSSRVEAGYQRNVSTSGVGGYMLLDRGFGKLVFKLDQRFLITLEGGGGYVQYGVQLNQNGDALGAQNETERNDVRIDGKLQGEYRPLSWFGLLAEVSGIANLTDFEYEQPTGIPDPAKFTAFQFFGGVRASY